MNSITTTQEKHNMMAIMAEAFGIPAREISRPDVAAVLANAMQRRLQYGWQPGVHMHIQRFEDKSTRNREVPDDQRVYNYTLVDGEKAWKESFIRWRTEYGVRWRFQRRTMTAQEIKYEAGLMGYTEAIPSNAFGVYSRIIIDGEDNPDDPDNPLWAVGLWFGKIRVGKYWMADNIPTGNSSRDVAVRRADKRAMMQSNLGLLPLDNRTEDQRRADLERAALTADAGPRRERPALSQDVIQEDHLLEAVDAEVVDGDIVDGEIVDEEGADAPDWSERLRQVAPDETFAKAFASDRRIGDQATSAYIVHARIQDQDSERPMSDKGYTALCTAIDKTMRLPIATLLLTVLLGRIVGPDARPGVDSKHIYADVTTDGDELTHLKHIAATVMEIVAES